jgi:hypothetical protein
MLDMYINQAFPTNTLSMFFINILHLKFFQPGAHVQGFIVLKYQVFKHAGQQEISGFIEMRKNL